MIACSSARAFDTRNYRIDAPTCSFKQIEERIARNPSDASAYCDRGLANLTAGECEDAIGDFTRALQFAPRLLRALYGRAQSYEMMGKDELALKDVDAILQMRQLKLRAESIKLKIAILKSMKRYADCLPLYSMLLTSTDLGVGRQDRIDLLIERGNLYLRLHKPELAIADLQQTMLHGEHVYNYIPIGKAYQMMGDDSKALEAFSKGLSLYEKEKHRYGIPDGRLTDFYRLRAAIYTKQGKTELAKADLDKISSKAYKDTYREIYGDK